MGVCRQAAGLGTRFEGRRGDGAAAGKQGSLPGRKGQTEGSEREREREM